VDGLFLQLDAAPGDRQAPSRVARIGIGAHGLGDHGDAGQVVSRLDRLEIGLARADRAAHAAEQVALVADVEPGVVELAVGPRARLALRRARLAAVAGGA